MVMKVNVSLAEFLSAWLNFHGILCVWQVLKVWVQSWEVARTAAERSKNPRGPRNPKRRRAALCRRSPKR